MFPLKQCYMNATLLCYKMGKKHIIGPHRDRLNIMHLLIALTRLSCLSFAQYNPLNDAIGQPTRLSLPTMPMNFNDGSRETKRDIFLKFLQQRAVLSMN